MSIPLDDFPLDEGHVGETPDEYTPQPEDFEDLQDEDEEEGI